jgi:acetoacetate decarboxylase
MLHSRWLPSIAADGADVHADLVTMRSADVEVGPVWRGTAELALYETPGEELASLRVVEPIAAYWRQVGATFVGGTPVA